MADVKVFHCYERGPPRWKEVARALEDSDIKVYQENAEADVSIVLGGMYENPVFLSGRKVLLYDKTEWTGGTWPLYEFVLSEYYHKLIDTTKWELDKIVGSINDLYNRGGEDRD